MGAGCSWPCAASVREGEGRSPANLPSGRRRVRGRAGRHPRNCARRDAGRAPRRDGPQGRPLLAARFRCLADGRDGGTLQHPPREGTLPQGAWRMERVAPRQGGWSVAGFLRGRGRREHVVSAPGRGSRRAPDREQCAVAARLDASLSAGLSSLVRRFMRHVLPYFALLALGFVGWLGLGVGPAWAGCNTTGCSESERDDFGCCPARAPSSTPSSKKPASGPSGWGGASSGGCQEGLQVESGHCCWPGQGYSSSTRACVGDAECPEGFSKFGGGVRQAASGQPHRRSAPDRMGDAGGPAADPAHADRHGHDAGGCCRDPAGARSADTRVGGVLQARA